jgi:hypothetical protein
VSLLLCALLAAARAPIVEGKIGEPGGAGAAHAQVLLAQGERTQMVRTGPDGTFRFRAFEGAATLTVQLPQGWTAAGALSRNIGPALRGEVLRADFSALAWRIVRGRLLVAGQPLPDAQVAAATASGQTDARGLFVLEGLPAGLVEVRVDAPPLTGRVELPPGPSDVARDVSVSVPDLAALRLARVPQDAVGRPIEDWLASRPLSQSEASGLERLAALVALDPAFRLAMVAHAGAAASGARAAAILQRYLTGPALVPRERLIFAVSEFARPGQLELILTRPEEPR